MKIVTPNQARKIIDFSVNHLANYIKDANLKSVILGISGGIDSAVVGIVGLLAIKKLKSIGYKVGYRYYFLDCDSSKTDFPKARALAKKFKFKLEEINLTKWFKSSPLVSKIPKNHPKSKVVLGNIKCRLRMITLYHFAQLENGIYLDTDDLSEEFMGFWTRHGDEGDVKIIQHFTKNEVYDLGEYLKFPNQILNSAPGDGLGVTDTNLASDQLGMSYLTIDYIISRFLQNKFDINGRFAQLKYPRYTKLTKVVANELKQNPKGIISVLSQALKTGFKRRYGDSVAHLLPDRTKFGLPNIGTTKFNGIYLAAIKREINKSSA